MSHWTLRAELRRIDLRNEQERTIKEESEIKCKTGTGTKRHRWVQWELINE